MGYELGWLEGHLEGFIVSLLEGWSVGCELVTDDGWELGRPVGKLVCWWAGTTARR